MKQNFKFHLKGDLTDRRFDELLLIKRCKVNIVLLFTSDIVYDTVYHMPSLLFGRVS